MALTPWQYGDNPPLDGSALYGGYYPNTTIPEPLKTTLKAPDTQTTLLTNQKT